MQYADEIVAFINENHANIYELSEKLGLGRTSLRKKLLNLGYKEDSKGCWVFNGPPHQEPKKVDVTKRVSASKKNDTDKNLTTADQSVAIYNRILELDDNNKTRTTIVADANQVEKMKNLSKRYKLKLSDLYSLALMEFTQKYNG